MHSKQHIISALNAAYGIAITSLTPLPWGADMHASLYKAQGQEVWQEPYFIKLKRGHQHHVGVTVIELLHDAGIKQVIVPIKTREAQPLCSIGDDTLIVYPFIEGNDGFNRPLNSSQWIELGKTLRRIHDMKVPNSLETKIKREIYASKWEMVQHLLHHIETGLDVDEVGSKCVTFMKNHMGIINELMERTEILRQKIGNESPHCVLCHADIHGGNVLIAGEGSIYIVDWDDPIMAPRERDLMFIGAGVGNVWNQADEVDLFYRGYGAIEVNRVILAYYRHVRIIEDIAEFGQELLLTPTSRNRLEMYKQFVALFAPNGVFDNALKIRA